jgi:hypothetical protein
MKIEKRMEFISTLIEENCLSCADFRVLRKKETCVCDKVLTPIKNASETSEEKTMLIEEWSKQQEERLSQETI